MPLFGPLSESVLRIHCGGNRLHRRGFHPHGHWSIKALQTSSLARASLTQLLFLQVKEISAESPDDVTAFYSSRGIDPTVTLQLLKYVELIL